MSPVLGPVTLSLQVASVSTAIVLPIAIGFAWLLSRRRVPGRSLISALLNMPLVLPPVVTGFFLLDLFGRRGIVGRFLGLDLAFTWWAAVLASVVVSLPLAVWTTKVALDGIDPALENAARLLGRGEWQVFLEITLPLARRGIVGGAVLAFARSLGEFGATIVVAGSTPGETLTMPSAVYLYMNQAGMEGAVATLVWIAAALSFVSLLLVNVFVWSRQ
jgi:molybdate transport system permease protein